MSWSWLWHAPLRRKPVLRSPWDGASSGSWESTSTIDISYFDGLPHGLLFRLTCQENRFGHCRQHYMSWPRQSLISLLHRIILMKMLCTPSRGSSSWFTTEQAPQRTSIRRAANCLGRRVMSIWSHRQLQPWSSTYDEQYSRADMAGIRRRHCHHQPTGVGSRPAIYIQTSLDIAALSIKVLPGTWNAWKRASARR